MGEMGADDCHRFALDPGATAIDPEPQDDGASVCSILLELAEIDELLVQDRQPGEDAQAPVSRPCRAVALGTAQPGGERAFAVEEQRMIGCGPAERPGPSGRALASRGSEPACGERFFSDLVPEGGADLLAQRWAGLGHP